MTVALVISVWSNVIVFSPESLSEQASDVWSYGITMFEVYSRGSKPYVGVENHEVLDYLNSGKRLSKPDGCPQPIYAIMESCWRKYAETRPSFADVVTQLRKVVASYTRTTSVGEGDSGGRRDTDLKRAEKDSRAKAFAIESTENLLSSEHDQEQYAETAPEADHEGADEPDVSNGVYVEQDGPQESSA
eukprot:Opistho-2@27747